jgi:predicted nuclease with TOPRIM domain
MNLTQVIMLLSALGVGGYIPTLWRNVFGRKALLKKQEQDQRQLELNEAEVLSRLSTAIRAEIREENKDLRERMDRVVEAVCGLTDQLDELFPKFTGLTDEERTTLRAGMSRARRAGSA